MSDVSEKPRYWTLHEALRQTADPIEWARIKSQRGLRLIGLGPTVEIDQPLVDENIPQPSSILPGRVTYVADVRNNPRGRQYQDLESLRKAARPLRQALIARVLEATGIPFGKNERVSILSDLWHGLIINFETSSVEDDGGRRFDVVRITRATQPLAEAPSETQSLSLLITRTGASCIGAKAIKRRRLVPPNPPAGKIPRLVWALAWEKWPDGNLPPGKTDAELTKIVDAFLQNKIRLGFDPEDLREDAHGERHLKPDSLRRALGRRTN